MARPRTPLADLELQGSPNMVRALKREPRAKHRVTVPPAPQHLSDLEKQNFSRVCATLKAKGTLAAQDGLLIERYAVLRARWETEDAALKREGHTVSVTRLDRKGNPVTYAAPNPRLKSTLAMERTLLGLEKSLGLVPEKREPEATTDGLSRGERALRRINDITEGAGSVN